MREERVRVNPPWTQTDLVLRGGGWRLRFGCFLLFLDHDTLYAPPKVTNLPLALGVLKALELVQVDLPVQPLLHLGLVLLVGVWRGI